MDEAMKFYHQNLLKNERALEYLEKRGVTEVAIGKFFLGLAPNSNFELKEYLREKNTQTMKCTKQDFCMKKTAIF